jgi:hypothetical protein
VEQEEVPSETMFIIGTKVVYNSKLGQSLDNDHRATVILHGGGRDESGISHYIRFEHGRCRWAFPQELTPTSQNPTQST